jgi:hypothetical protein
MAESHGSGHVRGRSAQSGARRLDRGTAHEFHWLGRAHVGLVGCLNSIGRTWAWSRTGASKGQLAPMARSVRVLAGLGDGLIGPSPRVMNSIYIYR